MSKPPLVVEPGLDLRELAVFLTEHGVSGVPVVDGGRVVGVVSASDVVERERGLDVACLSHLVASVPGVIDVESRVTVRAVGKANDVRQA